MVDFVKAKTNCYISYSHKKKQNEEKERISNIVDGISFYIKGKKTCLFPCCLSPLYDPFDEHQASHDGMYEQCKKHSTDVGVMRATNLPTTVDISVVRCYCGDVCPV